MKYILFFAFLLFSFGIYLESFFNLPKLVLVLLFIFTILTTFTSRKKHSFFMAFLMMSVVLLGMLSFNLHPSHHSEILWDKFVKNRSFINVEGVVSHDLRIRDDGEISYYQFILSDLKIDDNHLPGKLLVRGNKSINVSYGQRIQVEGVLRNFNVQRNPHGFNEKKYYLSKNIYASFKAKKIKVINSNQGVYLVKNKLTNIFNSNLTKEVSEICQAIFIGERSNLDYSLKEAFSNSGTMHLFAISGLHVGLISCLLLLMLSFLSLPKKINYLILITTLIIYAWFVGGNPPVVRATIMISLFLLSDILNRRAQGMNVLGFSGICILLFNPHELWSVGFQLSFCAVFGLIFFMPYFYSIKDIRDRKSDSLLRKTRFYFKGIWIVSVVAWVATAPLIMNVFNKINLVSPVFNIFLVPIAFILVSLLTIASVLSLINPLFFILFKYPIEICSKLMVYLTKEFNEYSSFVFQTANWHFVTLIFFMACIVFFILNSKKLSRRIKVIFFILVLFNTIFLNNCLAIIPNKNHSVTFFDIGQGDGILIELQDRRTFLIDTGKRNYTQKAIIPYLKSQGISKIDSILISHPQFDHAGGLEKLINEFEVKRVFTSGDRVESLFYNEALERMKEKSVEHLFIGRGDVIQIDKNIKFEVIYPDPNRSRHLKINDKSLVFYFILNEICFLFTGDIEEEAFSHLVEITPKRKVDFLKTPHHGAKLKSSGLLWLEHVRPSVAVTQVGQNNRYRHPHRDTEKALSLLSKRTYRTDKDGAIQVKIDADGEYEVKAWLKR